VIIRPYIPGRMKNTSFLKTAKFHLVDNVKLCGNKNANVLCLLVYPFKI
jgi:hypothetical protein